MDELALRRGGSLGQLALSRGGALALPLRCRRSCTPCASASTHPRPQSTAERLRAAEELILEGRNYLAARSTLKDILP